VGDCWFTPGIAHTSHRRADLLRDEFRNKHPRCNLLYDPSHFVLQQLDYIQYIDFYHERIRMFHVKDAEFNPTGKSGVYGGYQGWVERPGRFRSLGDGQVDFSAIFSKLSQYGFDGWAVMEWECAIKSPEQGAREGAPFIASHIIEVTGKAFDDFAGTGPDDELNKKILGLK
ncbi:MAG: sugar phosphate isomerase/epimerase, partial [Cyclobacteriaceae bacterium]